jgi:hypothetical protein
MPIHVFDFALARELSRRWSSNAYKMKASFEMSLTQSRAAIDSSRKLLAGPHTSLPSPRSSHRVRRAALAMADEYRARASLAADSESNTVLLEMRQLWIDIAYAG